MDIPVADALLGSFGPFLLPVALFAAGVIGYGVLLFAGRLLSADGSPAWRTEDSEEVPDADADGHEG